MPFLKKGCPFSEKGICLFSETHLRFLTKARPFFLAGTLRFSCRLFQKFTGLHQFCYKSVPNPLQTCTASGACHPPLATPWLKELKIEDKRIKAQLFSADIQHNPLFLGAKSDVAEAPNPPI